ncbi:MAG: ROK family protein [Actinomycetota bacterium]|nr:ROK family protein [Actinomycetota bacterium]
MTGESASADRLPVLEIGGTHVTGALVDAHTWHLVESHRRPLNSNGDAEEIVGAFVAAGDQLNALAGLTWGVAMPDPFDYTNGIATFRDVGKFDAIYGMDIRQALTRRLKARPAHIAFLNDADAFVLGEWTSGSAVGYRRCVGITLGTGIGSGWLIDGEITVRAPGVPDLGRARNLKAYGAGLEETVSSRGIRRNYAGRTGDTKADVADIADRARGGDSAAVQTLRHTFEGLGQALAPAARDFGADVVVIGGSMARSWDLFEPWFRDGLQWQGAPPVRVAADLEAAALVGATCHALRLRTGS